MIHSIHAGGGRISSFKSYCGGLIAPESDDNPWHYKFTWNPKNIITAGVGGSRYLLEGNEVFVPYQQIFDNNPAIHIDGVGPLAWYPNRDSLKYLELYAIPDITTFLRATFRYPEFCAGWQALIQLGLTVLDDAFETHGLTCADWLIKKLGEGRVATLKHDVAQKLGLAENDHVLVMLEWLGLFSETPLPAGWLTSGEILLALLLDKWHMNAADRDMVVMQHEIGYSHPTEGNRVITSTLVIKGDDRDHSAMAKTVGMPMALLAEQVLTGTVAPIPGVLIPNMAAIYEPVLAALEGHGIVFVDIRE
ncbi:MAG: hypothetical protein EBZ77_17545 [Chitinophagia bacterium]|nr:hypothetical protein [Chitinophagia bacterium]